MGIAAATIKSKSKLAQPPKRFSYLYNVVIRALFPEEHALPSGQLSERYGRACDRSVLCLTAPTKRRFADASIGGIKDARIDRRRDVATTRRPL